MFKIGNSNISYYHTGLEGLLKLGRRICKYSLPATHPPPQPRQPADASTPAAARQSAAIT